jgi:putative ABC transport system ATP-binding protein
VTGESAEDPPLFALADVSQERGGREVLRSVTLELPARRVVAIIGPSGAGKSSLIRLLNRLDDPTSGTVRFRGAPVTAMPVRALRRRVGFVFQSPTMFPGTVADNLRAAARYEGGAANAPRAFIRFTVGVSTPAPGSDAALGALLESVELDRDFLARDASSLSGGEQQRVSIARALATMPEVLVLDEPTSALDPEVAERFMRTVARLRQEQMLSVIMVTHRLVEARQWSDATVMLDAGRVVEWGGTAALFDTPREARTRAFVQSAG